MAGGNNSTPEVMEHISLPCLRILQQAMTPAPVKAPPSVAIKPPAKPLPVTSKGLPPRKPRSKSFTSAASSAAPAAVAATTSGAAKDSTRGSTSKATAASKAAVSVVSPVMSGQYEKGCRVSVNLQKWLQGDPEHSFESWQKRNKIIKNDKKPLNYAKMTKASYSIL